MKSNNFVHICFKISSSYTDKPESSDMEALTLTIKTCSVVIIGMSDEFCNNPECKKLLLYVKDVLHKPILLVLLGKTKNWQKGDLNMAFGTEVKECCCCCDIITFWETIAFFFSQKKSWGIVITAVSALLSSLLAAKLQGYKRRTLATACNAIVLDFVVQLNCKY